MLKLIVGLKGSGKTKTLIELANIACEESKGAVACLEKGSKLRFDIRHQVRLIDTDEYGIEDAHALQGFVAGMLASNHDVTDLFIDSAYKICGNADMAAFEASVLQMGQFSDKFGFNLVMTISVAKEDLPASFVPFFIN